MELLVTYYTYLDMKNKDALVFYRDIAKDAKNPAAEKLLPSNDNTEIDAQFIKNYCHAHTRLLDMGTGSGLTINRLVNNVQSIVAVEKFKEFSSFISKSSRIKIVLADILEYEPDQVFDLVTLFGVVQYFDKQEIAQIYNRMYRCLDKSGQLIVKNQFGIKEEVVVDGFSQELNKKYYAVYRHLDTEIALLQKAEFKNITVHDIYPPEKNKWGNTHYYALVCNK